MSYRIVPRNVPLNNDDNVFYINIRDEDGNDHSLRTGNENNNYDDTDNIYGIKKVMAKILNEDVDNILLTYPDPLKQYVLFSDDDKITNNLDLILFRKSSLKSVLDNSKINALGEAISIKSSMLDIETKDDIHKFFRFFPLFFDKHNKHNKYYEIIIEGTDWDSETLSILLDSLLQINLATVTSIYMIDTTFTGSEENVKKLCRIINKSNLTHFFMKYVAMTEQSFTTLIHCLRHKHLIKLTIDSCDIGDNRVKEIVSMFEQHNKITLPQNTRYLGRQMPNELINIIQNKYDESKPVIKILDLSNNNITSTGIVHLAKLLGNSDTLEELYINGNDQLSKDDVYMLLEQLSNRQKHVLKVLDARDIGDHFEDNDKLIVDFDLLVEFSDNYSDDEYEDF